MLAVPIQRDRPVEAKSKGMFKSCVQGCALALVCFVFLVKNRELWVLIFILQNGLLRAVRGTVVDDNHLFFNALHQLRRLDFVQNQVDGWGLVEGWNDDGEGHN